MDAKVISIHRVKQVGTDQTNYRSVLLPNTMGKCALMVYKRLNSYVIEQLSNTQS